MGRKRPLAHCRKPDDLFAFSEADHPNGRLARKSEIGRSICRWLTEPAATKIVDGRSGRAGCVRRTNRRSHPDRISFQRADTRGGGTGRGFREARQVSGWPNTYRCVYGELIGQTPRLVTSTSRVPRW